MLQIVRDEAERIVDRYFVLRSNYFNLTLQETAECDEIHDKLLAALTGTDRPQLDNIAVEMGAIFESIQDILDGKEVSDFMLSFPIVREVWDLKHSALASPET